MKKKILISLLLSSYLFGNIVESDEYVLKYQETFESGWHIIGSNNHIGAYTYNRDEIVVSWVYDGTWRHHENLINIPAFQGHWILVDDNQTFTTKETFNKENLVEKEYSFYLSKGWNLKGTSFPISIENVYKNQLTNETIDYIYTYRDQSWELNEDIYKIKPGEGYWIKSDYLQEISYTPFSTFTELKNESNYFNTLTLTNQDDNETITNENLNVSYTIENNKIKLNWDDVTNATSYPVTFEGNIKSNYVSNYSVYVNDIENYPVCFKIQAKNSSLLLEEAVECIQHPFVDVYFSNYLIETENTESNITDGILQSSIDANITFSLPETLDTTYTLTDFNIKKNEYIVVENLDTDTEEVNVSMSYIVTIDTENAQTPTDYGEENCFTIELKDVYDNEYTSDEICFSGINLTSSNEDTVKLVESQESNDELLNFVNTNCNQDLNTWGEVYALTTLNCADNTATIPDSFFELTNLENLNLSNNSLSNIPSNIYKLVNLTSLDLSNNSISSIDNTLINLTLLKDLDLSNNQLSSLDTFILSLTKLEDLNLSHNNLTDISNLNLQNNDNITILNLSHNNLDEDDIEDINLDSATTLEELYLNHNELTTFDIDISSLTQLTQLNISDNEIVTLNSSVYNHDYLEYLNISNNSNLKTLNNIDNADSLKMLIADNIGIITIPEDLTNATQLKALSLNDNTITTLHSDFDQLINLKLLSLSNINISGTLNTDIESLTNLIYLDISNNNISDVSTNFDSSLTNLRILDISENSSFDNLDNLENLNQLDALRLDCQAVIDDNDRLNNTSTLYTSLTSNSSDYTLSTGLDWSDYFSNKFTYETDKNIYCEDSSNYKSPDVNSSNTANIFVGTGALAPTCINFDDNVNKYVSYTNNLSASDPNSDSLTFSWESTAISGVSLDSNGTFTIVNTTNNPNDTFSSYYVVSDGTYNDTCQFSFTLLNENPSCDAQTFNNVLIGEALDFNLSVRDTEYENSTEITKETLTFTILNSTAGLDKDTEMSITDMNLSIIDGAITTAGTYYVDINVSDSDDNSDECNITLNVINTTPSCTLTTYTTTTGTEFSFDINASDQDTDYGQILTYTLNSTIDGNLSQGEGVNDGNITSDGDGISVVGTYDINVTVSDSIVDYNCSVTIDVQ